VVTDSPVEGDASALPDFFRDHHALTARAMNARLGRGGPFWTTGGPDNVELHGRELTIEQQLLYAWTNPVKDGLCERPEDWPGLLFLPEDWGKTFTFRKPEDGFFGGRRPARLAPTDPDALADWQAALRAEAEDAERLDRERDRARRAREAAQDRKRVRRGGRGVTDKQRRQLAKARAARKAKKEKAPRPARASRSSLPEFVQVTPVPPPGYEHLTLDEVKAHFRRLLDAELARIHAERRRRGLTTFIGVERLVREDPREPAGDSFPTFARNPRIACRDRETRLGLLREPEALADRGRGEAREVAPRRPRGRVPGRHLRHVGPARRQGRGPRPLRRAVVAPPAAAVRCLTARPSASPS
jgi:hypothetical protein